MGTLTEEISRLEKIIDVSSAVGTVGVIGLAAGILLESPYLGWPSFALAEVGCLTTCVTSLISHYKNDEHHDPHLYWPVISIPAVVIVASYMSYPALHTVLPGVLNWISQSF